MTVWEKTISVLALWDPATSSGQDPDADIPDEARVIEHGQSGDEVPF